ncbi:hypothetical protein [Nostoc sp.]|uniref:hypothetical protein n=1 Tax=Nostoc sp. TaxID=1180 RepID=UPI002FF85D1D
MPTRIFLANPDIDVNIPSYIEEALDYIKNKREYQITWSAGQVKSIKVEDKAYLKKTGQGKRGFIAVGEVIEAKDAQRLNQLPEYPKYSKYSDAYTQHFFGNCPTVLIRLDEVVSLDSPLEDSHLLKLSSMQGVNLVRYGSGQELGFQYEAALDAEWKKYFKKVNKLY